MDDRRSDMSEAFETGPGPRYAGMRMTADEYEKLSEDGYRYEVIDGVVVMAPSPSYGHQSVASQIEWQIMTYLSKHPVGRVVHEIDINFDRTHVYRPDLVFLSTARFPRPTDRVRVAPDMILEVLSPATRALDLNTKREDYERFGVTEYWIVDPAAQSLTFLRLTERGKGALATLGYQPVAARGSKFKSEAIPGFTLDIAAVKRTMRE